MLHSPHGSLLVLPQRRERACIVSGPSRIWLEMCAYVQVILFVCMGMCPQVRAVHLSVAVKLTVIVATGEAQIVQN